MSGPGLSSPRKRPRAARRVVWALLPLVVVLAGAEGLARLLVPPPNASNVVVPDDELLFRLRPHPEPSDRAATNELELRDDPLRTDATLVILLLGDSVSYGYRIADRRLTFASLLERLLERRHPGLRCEVIDAGVPGYTTWQERRYLEKYLDGSLARELDARRGSSVPLPRPDLIVHQVCFNDLANVREYAQGRGPYAAIKRASRLVGWLAGVVRRARIATPTTHAEAFTALLDPATDAAWAEEWSAIDRELGLMKRAADDAPGGPIPLVTLVAPVEHQLADPRKLDLPQRRLAQILEARSIPRVDALDEFARVRAASVTRTGWTPTPGERPDSLFIDPFHFGPQGHKLQALVLAARLTQLFPRLLKRRAAAGSR